MKNQKNSKKVAAGILAAQIVLQAAAMNISAFADDVQTDAQEGAENANADASVTAPVDDTLTIANGTSVPEKLVEGKFVVIKGTVSSAVSNISKVSVGIYDKENNCIASGSADAKEKTFDLSQLDDKVSFNKLTEGDYCYKVIVSNDSNTDYVLVNQSFSVTNASETQNVDAQAPAASEDKLTISGNNTVPDIMKKGSSFSIQGTVTSSESDIVYLTAGVYDANGAFVTGRTIAPKVKTYDIRKLDAYIDFNKLNEGKYIYAVIATNAQSQNVALVNKQFTVSADGVTPPASTTDTMTVSNGTVIPDNLGKGKYLTVKGTVTSESSNITSLTVGVYDTNNKLVTGKTVSPNAKTYNLANLDNYVSFNTLAEGTYTYAVIATNGANKDFTVTSKKFTVGSQTSALDELKIANGTTVPEKLEKGKSVSVKGTVSSTTSNITSLTVGIYENRQGGKIITEKTVTPNAKTYDLSKLDNDIAFNKLTDGTYAYVVIATNANNGNYTLANQTFTVGNATAPAEDKITISGGTTIPATLAKGKAVSVKGTVTSEKSNITSLTVAVADAKGGGFMTGKTITPNAKTYDLRKLDAYVAFDKLPDGEYEYYVMASNSSSRDVIVAKSTFTVGNGASTTDDKMTVTNGTVVPANLAKGKAVNVKGTITSAKSNITSLTVAVADAKGGGFMTGKTITPNAKTYDLRKLDAYVAFDKLPDGEYKYYVMASNAANPNGVVVTESVFTVGNGATATDDKLTISNGTNVPDTLVKGKAVSVRGTVTSASSNITALTVGVYDSNGKFVTGRTIAPNAKSYDLSRLDNYVAFNTLGDGTYTYAVIATNAGNNNYTLVSKKFTIGNSSSTSNDKLTISGSTAVPDTLAKGKALNVTGTVTSANSNMTALTVGVYDTNGKFITGRTIAPNAKTYDLRKLDAYVAFNTLSEGNYIYAVIASNAGNTNYALVSKKFAVGNGGTSSNADALKITGGTNVPDTIAVGKAINVTGTVTSASSNMTALTVGVYDTNGKFITGRTIAPNAKTYDLRKLDAYVAFNKLTAGNYVYAVIASNAANNNTALVSKKFTVGNGGSSTTSTSDKLTVDGGTSVPSSLSKGKGVAVRGTVSSSTSNITSLTVGVYDSNGKLVTGKTIAPNAKSYNLSRLDSSVRFDQLSAGNYTYKVIATNGGNNSSTLVNQSFSVK